MDAGGLAQMTFNNFHQNAAPSFGSRGKGTHLRNISVPSSNNGGLSAPSGDVQQVPTPRSARSALLAGLRTAPKTPNPTPITAAVDPGMHQNRYMQQNTHYTGFTQQTMSALPQQRLPTPPSMSSPAIHVTDGEMDDHDAEQYQQMLAQNMYLNHVQAQLAAAQKVQQLQQQLAQLQMQSGMGYAATPPMSPGMGLGGINMYNQAMYYNPYQQFQQPQQHQQQSAGLYAQQHQHQQYSPPAQVEISPPTPQNEQPPSAGFSMNRNDSRSRSPPKLSLQNGNSNSLSSAPFRRGHRKASSLSTCTTINAADVAEAPKTSVPKSMMPSTPMTATFGPGHASGQHPIRQPKGPPSIEELRAHPTSKSEGSVNFAVRQRRRAISKLISAGIERRSARSTSAGTMTPVSENEGFIFNSSEDGRQSRQSLGEDGHSGSAADGLRVVISAAEKRKSALF